MQVASLCVISLTCPLFNDVNDESFFKQLICFRKSVNRGISQGIDTLVKIMEYKSIFNGASTIFVSTSLHINILPCGADRAKPLIKVHAYININDIATS